MAEMKRYEGTVKWFSGQRGFGFIAPADDSGDIFVHQSEIKAEGFRFLRDGERVEFSVDDSGGDGWKKAVDVVGFGKDRTYQPGGGRGRGRRGAYVGFGGGRVRGGRSGRGGQECYNCGRVGHFARDCFRGSNRVGDDQGYDHDGGGGGGRRPGACYHCGEEGHFARDCLKDLQN